MWTAASNRGTAFEPARRSGAIVAARRSSLDDSERRPRSPVDQIPATAPKQARQRLSYGSGAKDDRVYDWALLTLTLPTTATANAAGGC